MKITFITNLILLRYKHHDGSRVEIHWLFRWTLAKRKDVFDLLTLIKLHMSARRQTKIQIMLDYIKSRPIGKWERKAG